MGGRGGGRAKGVYPTYAKLIITTINGNHLKAAIYSDALQNSECNRVHLHIVFVLLYSVCRSVSVFSRVDVIQSFTYVLRVVILDVTKRRGESARESERQ